MRFHSVGLCCQYHCNGTCCSIHLPNIYGYSWPNSHWTKSSRFTYYFLKLGYKSYCFLQNKSSDSQRLIDRLMLSLFKIWSIELNATYRLSFIIRSCKCRNCWISYYLVNFSLYKHERASNICTCCTSYHCDFLGLFLIKLLNLN